MENGRTIDLDCQALLDLLHQKRPLPQEQSATRFERVSRKPARFFQITAIACFIALFIIVAGVMIVPSVSAFWLSVAKILYLALSISCILWMLADILPALIAMLAFQKIAYASRRRAIQHDLNSATELRQFAPATLALTDQWLALRIESMRRRVGTVLGGSDKAAVVALLIGAWALWTNFPSDSATWQQYAYALSGALIGGFGIGGLLTNVVIAELSYQRDLLAIARNIEHGP